MLLMNDESGDGYTPIIVPYISQRSEHEGPAASEQLHDNLLAAVYLDKCCSATDTPPG